MERRNGPIALGDLSNDIVSSWAIAVSADGTVVVGGAAFSNGSFATQWTAEGGIQSLGLLDESDRYSTSNFVSSDGSLIFGDSVTLEGAFRTFVWSQRTGMLDLVELLRKQDGLATVFEN